jgi:hypothetical protein
MGTIPHALVKVPYVDDIVAIEEGESEENAIFIMLTKIACLDHLSLD